MTRAMMATMRIKSPVEVRFLGADLAAAAVGRVVGFTKVPIPIFERPFHVLRSPEIGQNWYRLEKAGPHRPAQPPGRLSGRLRPARCSGPASVGASRRRP